MQPYSSSLPPTSSRFEKWQKEMQEEIVELKHQLENKNERVDELSKRVVELEREKDALRARREQAVTALGSITPLHQEAAMTLATGMKDLEDDDLEGAITVWVDSMNKAMNHHFQNHHQFDASFNRPPLVQLPLPPPVPHNYPQWASPTYPAPVRVSQPSGGPQPMQPLTFGAFQSTPQPPLVPWAPSRPHIPLMPQAQAPAATRTKKSSRNKKAWQTRTTSQAGWMPWAPGQAPSPTTLQNPLPPPPVSPSKRSSQALPALIQYAYPPKYNSKGYCMAHGKVFPACFTCTPDSLLRLYWPPTDENKGESASKEPESALEKLDSITEQPDSTAEKPGSTGEKPDSTAENPTSKLSAQNSKSSSKPSPKPSPKPSLSIQPVDEP